MKASAGVFFGRDSSGSDSARSSGYTPFYGVPRSLRIIVALLAPLVHADA